MSETCRRSPRRDFVRELCFSLRGQLIGGSRRSRSMRAGSHLS